MKRKIFAFGFLTVLTVLLFQTLPAQNTSPFWSLSGNNNASSSSKLGTANNIPLRFFTKNKERLRIDTSGKVGIGTKDPTYMLHVEGGSSFAAVYGNDSLGYGIYGTGGAYGVYGNGHDGVFGWSNSGHYGVYGLSSSNFSTTGGSIGVYGEAYYGVQGTGTVGVNGTGSLWGIYGFSAAKDGFGVYGFSPNYGVRAAGDAGGIWAEGSGQGTYAGFFDGNVYTTGIYFTSDSSLKKNITGFTKAIDIINKLQPKFYEFRHDGNYKLMNLPEGKHYGLIAQDLEDILPGLVNDTKFNTRFSKQSITAGGTLNDKTSAQNKFEVIDFKAVNYTELIPILIKAVQEQQVQIQQQQTLSEKQQTQIEDLKNEISSLKQDDVYITSAGILNQAIPNPTNGIAHISYRLPEGFVNAQLLITDMAGKIVNVFSLNSSGNVDMNTSALSNGVYNYSMQLDSKTFQTKKMVVAH